MAVVKLTQTYVDKTAYGGSVVWVSDAVTPGLRLYIGSKAKTYFLSYRRADGKKDQYRIGDAKILTVAQARETAKKILAQMTMSNEDVKEKKKEARGASSQAPSVRKLLAAYMAAGGSKFIENMLADFGKLLDMPVKELTSLRVEKWRVAQKEKTGNKNSTLNKKLSSLNVVLNFAVERDLITVNPIAKVKKLSEEDSDIKLRYLSADERTRLLRELDAMDAEARAARERTRSHAKGKHLPAVGEDEFANYFKPLVLLSLNTGIRRGAMLALEWRDIDFDSRTITLRAQSAKSRKHNIVPMNDVAYNVLKTWSAQRTDPENPLLFPSPVTGERFNSKIVSKFATLLRRAGIKNFRWHDMRHDFASRLVMAGVDLNTVRELMTHSDISMTLRYAHLAPEKKLEAVNRLCND